MNPKGVCVWFTGQPSAGKTTLATRLAKLIEGEGRRVTLLDGDVVRAYLSKGLGFSREDRDTNVLRIGWVASQITVHCGVVLCAVVSPYEETRERLRAIFPTGQFMLIHVDTPPEICERRDAKGMYAKARAGELRGFTGVDDPYERPMNPELRIDTSLADADANAETVFQFLKSRKVL